MPACKPFVSPEALAAAAAAAAADAEAKRKAATIGSPLSAFASLSPGPSPQRSSLDALRAAQAAAEARMSGASVAAPASPSTTDRSLAGSSPAAESAVAAALQQLSGAGFSAQVRQGRAGAGGRRRRAWMPRRLLGARRSSNRCAFSHPRLPCPSSPACPGTPPRAGAAGD